MKCVPIVWSEVGAVCLILTLFCIIIRLWQRGSVARRDESRHLQPRPQTGFSASARESPEFGFSLGGFWLVEVHVKSGSLLVPPRGVGSLVVPRAQAPPTLSSWPQTINVGHPQPQNTIQGSASSGQKGNGGWPKKYLCGS
jgi:hypothetical protein